MTASTPHASALRVAHRGDRAQHFAAIAMDCRDETGIDSEREVDHGYPLVQQHRGDGGCVLGSHQDVRTERRSGESPYFANRVTNFIRRQRRRRQQAEAAGLRHGSHECRHREMAHAGVHHRMADGQHFGHSGADAIPPFTPATIRG